MLNLLLIFVGAGLGGVLRYGMVSGVYALINRQFPYGTLVVNVTGSFIMGFLFVVLFDRYHGVAPHLRALLLIGLLGGYTTFSSFSIETLSLLESGAWLSALLNILFSIMLCLLAVWLGALVGRQ